MWIILDYKVDKISMFSIRMLFTEILRNIILRYHLPQWNFWNLYLPIYFLWKYLLIFKELWVNSYLNPDVITTELKRISIESIRIVHVALHLSSSANILKICFQCIERYCHIIVNTISLTQELIFRSVTCIIFNHRWNHITISTLYMYVKTLRCMTHVGTYILEPTIQCL